jgi:hypothetical protein
MSSLRRQLDQHFNQHKKYSASKELDHEGMLDENMESIFNQPTHSVEVGKRRLGNEDIDLGAQY